MEGKQTEIRKVTINSKEYPKRLKKLSGMPKELYIIGNLPEDNDRLIGELHRCMKNLGMLKDERFRML